MFMAATDRQRREAGSLVSRRPWRIARRSHRQPSAAAAATRGS
jgi:hypothetical protein